MLALSMMQPYAFLMARGYLKIDDRGRPTPVRGPVAIHASKRFHLAYHEFIKEHTNWLMPDVGAFEHGGIVGVADLVDCLAPAATNQNASGRNLDLTRAHFGAAGMYGYVFENPRAIPLAPCRGSLGFFEVPDVVLETAE